ncbi:maleylpyruvate isomerase family mycothiol-dependent enzyme [Prauserella salsuginis]|uniref:Maleylpyruvate isomerase family mycothiol-dependent enzyme n=1 Tax=Prauserella salsuginis TaxID=387889 RepID=A0ABW6G1V7_9PSEU|nr:maleylpyruvate isomerase family mycothiol-dependent enzyme [Prauserella salsuginis]
MTAFDEQGDALREAALAAGPEATVPTCPEWTVARLVRHVAAVQAWVLACIADPHGGEPRGERPPKEWDEIVPWWDGTRAELRRAFDSGPETPAHMPFPCYEANLRAWARRQAHEAAIHRLDAELAAGRDATTFDTMFAADGVDEALSMIIHRRRADWSAVEARGTVLVHAEDARRLWSLALAPGQPPALTGPADPDVTLSGGADAVYKRLWRRPADVSITGEATLLDPLETP